MSTFIALLPLLGATRRQSLCQFLNTACDTWTVSFPLEFSFPRLRSVTLLTRTMKIRFKDTLLNNDAEIVSCHFQGCSHHLKLLIVKSTLARYPLKSSLFLSLPPFHILSSTCKPLAPSLSLLLSLSFPRSQVPFFPLFPPPLRTRQPPFQLSPNLQWLNLLSTLTEEGKSLFLSREPQSEY